MLSTNLLIDLLAAELTESRDTLAAVAYGVADLDGVPDDPRASPVWSSSSVSIA
jgi:hypothetical protein